MFWMLTHATVCANTVPQHTSVQANQLRQPLWHVVHSADDQTLPFIFCSFPPISGCFQAKGRGCVLKDAHVPVYQQPPLHSTPIFIRKTRI